MSLEVRPQLSGQARVVVVSENCAGSKYPPLGR